jgi:hypothetical protein
LVWVIAIINSKPQNCPVAPALLHCLLNATSLSTACDSADSPPVKEKEEEKEKENEEDRAAERAPVETCSIVGIAIRKSTPFRSHNKLTIQLSRVSKVEPQSDTHLNFAATHLPSPPQLPTGTQVIQTALSRGV